MRWRTTGCVLGALHWNNAHTRRANAHETSFLARFHVPLHIVHGAVGAQAEATRQLLAALPALVIGVQILVAELATALAHLGHIKFARLLRQRPDG